MCYKALCILEMGALVLASRAKGFLSGKQCETHCQLQCFPLIPHQTSDHFGCCVQRQNIN